MQEEYSKGSHTVYDIKYHIIWATKYRYKIFGGEISKRLRTLITQGCETRNMTIISGSIGKDHVHMLLSCPPSKVVQYLKGKSSRIMQEEYPEIKKKYWGQHMWARGYFCATVGNVNEETIKRYIENQELSGNSDVFKITE